MERNKKKKKKKKKKRQKTKKKKNKKKKKGRRKLSPFSLTITKKGGIRLFYFNTLVDNGI